MSQFDTILFDKSGALGHISLNRPQVLNAYRIQMRDDFSEALSAVQDDPEVRALLITGQGRAFCAGADLSEFGTAPSQVIARRVRWDRDVWSQLLGLTVPVVVAVHGYCIGSGVEIALLGDLRIAAEGTTFAMPEVRLGMVPAAGGSQTLPRNANSSEALDLLLTGRRFGEQEALQLRLITRVAPEAELLESASQAAQELASLDPLVVTAAKSAMSRGADLPLEDALTMESRLAIPSLQEHLLT